MSVSENREFKISNNMIFHLVFSQAGTHAKAFGELAMNAHDAGADLFRVEIDNNGFKVSDNGRGFRSRQEIESWFEELGFDHTDEMHQEEGRFSRFGLGRAQIMAFAPTLWQTNTFAMSVDIKARGISYDLSVDQPQVDGCTISGQWYEPLSFADIKDLLREFEALVAYAALRIEVNGKVVNRTDTQWDYETEQVYIKRKETGPLAVYNQGILVRSYPSYQYGSGVVVSKVPLTLNIARNDVLTSTCRVWKEVREFLRSEASGRSKKKQRLNDDERQLLLDQLLAGDIDYREIQQSPLLEDVTGRKWRLDKLARQRFSIHTHGSKLEADRIQQSKQAFVLSKRMIEMCGVETAEELVSVLSRFVEGTYVPIDELLQSNNEYYALLKEKELTKVERVGLAGLRRGFSQLQDAVSFALTGSYHRGPKRTLHLGVSEHANAWTDGASFVAINRNVLRKHIRDGFRGFTALTNLLVHELCHEENSATSHDHGAEFFEAFHEVLCGSLTESYGTALRTSMVHFLGRAQKEGLKLSRNELRDLDREVEIERVVYGDDALLSEVNEAAV